MSPLAILVGLTCAFSAVAPTLNATPLSGHDAVAEQHAPEGEPSSTTAFEERDPYAVAGTLVLVAGVVLPIAIGFLAAPFVIGGGSFALFASIVPSTSPVFAFLVYAALASAGAAFYWPVAFSGVTLVNALAFSVVAGLATWDGWVFFATGAAALAGSVVAAGLALAVVAAASVPLSQVGRPDAGRSFPPRPDLETAQGINFLVGLVVVTGVAMAHAVPIGGAAFGIAAATLVEGRDDEALMTCAASPFAPLSEPAPGSAPASLDDLEWR